MSSVSKGFNLSFSDKFNSSGRFSPSGRQGADEKREDET
jgi:hypothetical protein